MNDFLARVPSLLVAISLSTAIMYLPGSAILFRMRALRNLDMLSRLCIAPGVSIALYVVLFEVAEVFHMRMGWWTPWLIVLLALVSLLCQRPRLPQFTWTADTPAHIAFAIVTLVIFASRLAAIEGLVAPLWGDSVHHTVIVQLMLENGGLFQSWQPYDDATTFTYHYGFHALAVMYAWMRGMSAEFAVLLMGQIANVGAVIALYALVRQWTKSPWGGIFAMIAGGLISTYPYAFVDWGRYTQLTAHVVLIAVLVLFSFYLSQRRARSNIALLVLLALVIAGIGLAQYKVAVLFLVFCLALVVFRFLAGYWQKHDLRHAFLASFGRAGAIAILAVFLFLPRGFDIVSSNLGGGIQKRLSTDFPLVSSTELAARPLPNALTLSQSGLNNNTLWIWWIGLIGIALMAVTHRKGLWFPAGAALSLLAVDPRIVGISRIGLVDEFHLSLTVYIVISGLAGFTFGAIMDALIRRTPKTNLVGLLCAGVMVVYGVRSLPPIPTEDIFVLPEDIQMMDWIHEHVPASSKIAATGSIAFDSYTVGRDAGWWLPYYTHNPTNIMLMAAGQEKTSAYRRSQPGFALTQELYKRDMALPSSAQWLTEMGYRYFYVGEKSLGSEKDQVKLVNQLLENPALRVIHRVGSAYLLSVEP